MIDELRRIFQIPELKQKILFTLAMLVVCRIGVFVPVPGINGEVAMNYFRQFAGGGQGLFQMVSMFTGGAFSQMTVFALGVVPYISASIMLQVLTAVIPSLQREIRENPESGKKKMTKYTRMVTLFLSAMQSAIYAGFALRMNMSTPGIVAGELVDITLFGMPVLFYTIVIATMTTGTLFMMWIGEQITEKGIGNGVSIIIATGILSQLPGAMGLIFQQLNLDSQEPGQMNFTIILVLSAIFVLVTIATIMLIQGQRRIPLQHARRVVGRKEVQGGSSYIPLKVNYAGVVPVIFASAMLMFPATIGKLLGETSWLGVVTSWISYGSNTHLVLYVTLIFFFTYFWTITQFRPDQVASDMKKNGAFIPGIRQGKPTQDYLEAVTMRITFIGATYLALLAISPNIVGKVLAIPSNISYFFGGTTLLILVGVVLDTMKQIESHLLMRQYQGFMKRGKIRGR